MINIKFRLNNGAKITDLSKKSYIYIRINNGEKVDYTTSLKVSVFPKDWDSKKQRVRNRAYLKNSDQINHFLQTIRNHFEAKTNELLFKGKEIKLKDLKRIHKEYFTPTEELEEITLFTFIQQYIEDAKTKPHHKTGKLVSIGTIKVYKGTLNTLNDFVKENYNIDFENIDLDFYYDFIEWLENKGYSRNYIGKHIKTLKAFMSEALEQGHTDNRSYQSKKFMVLREDINNVYLDEQELNTIWKLDLSHDKKMEQARDLFLIGAYTGLRVSDYNNLKDENIITLEGRKMLKVEIKKTGGYVTIPLHPLVRAIFEKYDNSPPPKMPDQHINRYIKEIGKVAKLDNYEYIKRTQGGKKVTIKKHKYELLMNHTGRRSFCTNAYYSGMASIDIRAISGHKTEDSFLKYIKVTNEKRAIKMAKNSFFSNHLKIV